MPAAVVRLHTLHTAVPGKHHASEPASQKRVTVVAVQCSTAAVSAAQPSKPAPMLRQHLACLQDTVIEEDKEFVTQYFDMPDTDFADMERMSPWLLRIELNREMLTDKGLNMSRIADTITSEFGEEMSVIFTDDNAPKHILRVSESTLCLV